MKQKRIRIELNPEALCSVNAFRHLPLADRKMLAKHCNAYQYSPGQQIVSYRDRTTNVFFIVSGRVRAILYSLSGKEVSLRELKAGEMFGELAAIDGEPRSATVVTLTESLIATISADDFWEALRNHPSVAETVLKRLAAMARLASEQVYELAVLPVKDRIHTELLRLAQDHPQQSNTAVVSPAPTHQDIANRIGTQREAVTRQLNTLKKAGLISKQGNEFIIHDVAQLADMVGEVLGENGVSSKKMDSGR